MDESENGFQVLDLNLEADEEKRAPEALQQLERSVLPMVWEKEYRKRFLGRGGQAIFGKQFRRTGTSPTTSSRSRGAAHLWH